jgi:hypothetical protein
MKLETILEKWKKLTTFISINSFQCGKEQNNKRFFAPPNYLQLTDSFLSFRLFRGFPRQDGSSDADAPRGRSPDVGAAV